MKRSEFIRKSIVAVILGVNFETEEQITAPVIDNLAPKLTESQLRIIPSVGDIWEYADKGKVEILTIWCAPFQIKHLTLDSCLDVGVEITPIKSTQDIGLGSGVPITIRLEAFDTDIKYWVYNIYGAYF